VLVILAAAVTVASGSLPSAPLLAETRIVRMDAQACKSQGTYQVSDPALLYRDDGSAKTSRLEDLPKANHEKAVVRMIGPCANPLVVRYGAGR
jgi:hypothetical protein